MSKRRKSKRIRSRAKQQLRSNAFAALAPMQSQLKAQAVGSGPVHICGTMTDAMGNPVKDNLTRLQREAIRDAATKQHCQAQSEVMLNHMMVQEHFGWTVRTYNPDLPPIKALDSRVEDLDEYVQSPAYERVLLTRKEHEASIASAKHAKLRQQTHIRNLIRQTTV